MAITKTQSVSGNGATVTLNGVVAANALTFQFCYVRFTSTGARASTPTDTNGTFTASAGDVNPVPAIFGGGDTGVGIWIEENAASGTHTVTPEADSLVHSTLCEFSGIAAASSLDASKSAITNNSNQTSQVTGTTAVTSQANELSLICLNAGAVIGVANIGLTDPVAGYTTLSIGNNTNSDNAFMHNFQVLSATGAQSATYNWTDNETQQVSIANIATFKAAGGATTTALAAAGTGVATGAGASTAASPLASSGAGTATAAGASTAAASLASTGGGVATGIGASTASAALSSSGVGTAVAVGAAVFGAQGALSAAGVGTALAAGASLAGADLGAPGVATAIAQVQDATPPQVPQAPSPPIDVGAGGGGNSKEWRAAANRRRLRKKREEEEIMAIAALIAPFLQSDQSRHVE